MNLDCPASTSALPPVADRVTELLPWYADVHRGAGYESQLSTAAYEGDHWPVGLARLGALSSAARTAGV